MEDIMLNYTHAGPHTAKLFAAFLVALMISGGDVRAASYNTGSGDNAAAGSTGTAAGTANSATMGSTAMVRDPAFDKTVMDTLAQCQNVSSSCSATTKNAMGILVFPNVVKADLIVGGAGGKGALIENGRITGYYNIGAASAGLQAGIETANQVYIFRTAEALAKLKEGRDWKVDTAAGVTLITADANVRGNADSDVLAYVFDSKGLHAGVSLDIFSVWRSGESRPS
jgi:lipid-binding SYLF domain-containing protein